MSDHKSTHTEKDVGCLPQHWSWLPITREDLDVIMRVYPIVALRDAPGAI